MRGNLIIITVLSLLMTLPAVAADDPGYTLPSTDELETAAGKAVAARTAATTDLTSGTFWNVSSAANEAQGNKFPASHFVEVANRTGVYGGSTVSAAAGLANIAVKWGTQTTLVKLAETGAMATAANAVGQAAIGAGENITYAALAVVCSQPVDAAAGCDESSIVGTANGEAQRVLDEGSQELTAEDFSGSLDAATGFLGGLIVLPS